MGWKQKARRCVHLYTGIYVTLYGNSEFSLMQASPRHRDLKQRCLEAEVLKSKALKNFLSFAL